MVRIDAIMKEAVIKKYAQLTGKSEDEVRAILEPIFEDEDKTKELIDLISKLSMIADKERGTLAGEVADAMKARLLTEVGHKALTPKDKVEKLVEKFEDVALTMKLIDKIFGGLHEKKNPESESAIVRILESRLSRLEDNFARLLEALEKKADSERESVLANTLKEIQKNMQEQINLLRKELQEVKSKKMLTINDIEDVKRQLEALGFEVKKAGTEFDIEKAKEFLAKLGYKIEPGWISADQLQKILEEERQKIRQQIREQILKEVETKKITAAEKIVTTAIDRLFEIFQPVLPQAFARALGLPEGQTPSRTPSKEIEKAIRELEREEVRRESGPKIHITAGEEGEE